MMAWSWFIFLGCSEYDLAGQRDVSEGTEEEESTVEPALPELVLDPEQLDFGTLPVNCPSAVAPVTISNQGEALLEIDSISLGGEHTEVFQLSDASPLDLEPGESMTLGVLSQLPDESAYEAEITIRSNDPERPEAHVSLEGEGTYSGTMEEVFEQDSNPAVDILWVIDNSGSMDDAVEHVYNNFSYFIDPFLSMGIDFRMAVVTTDMDNEAQSGRFQSAVITPESSDPAQDFLSAVSLGTGGSGSERGFDAIVAALSEPLVSTHNAGFLRDHALLATIVISDEDDDSDLDASEFASWYYTLKSDPSLLSFSAFCGDARWVGCSEWVSWSEGLITAQAGWEYHEAIDLIGGTWASICTDDFSDALSLFSSEASGLKERFVLSAVPVSVSDIEVLVDEQEVRYDNADGWLYDSEQNAVVFYGEAIPAPGSRVEISYAFHGGC